MAISPRSKRRIIQIVLFIITLVTTTIAGAEWRYGKYFYGEDPLLPEQIPGGLFFSVAFLTILTFHEFGHYLTAKYHGVKVSFPYYIPLWLGFIPGAPSIGTMGAFIRIRERVQSRKLYFDIGVAGPLAGFVVALVVIIYGFLNLPGLEYLFEIHPDYAQYGSNYANIIYNDNTQFGVIKFGPNLLYWIFENTLPFDRSLLPHPNEIIHYPYFLAGYLALFFTSLNLFPIGQLDGGHVLYGILGEKVHRIVAPIFYIGVLYYAGLGLFDPRDLDFTFVIWSVLYIYFLYFCLYSLHPERQFRWFVAITVYLVQCLTVLLIPGIEGYMGWLLFLFLVGRFLGVHHPPVADNRPLSTGRKIVGWIAMLVFILSFSPKPLIIAFPDPEVIRQQQIENEGQIQSQLLLDKPDSPGTTDSRKQGNVNP